MGFGIVAVDMIGLVSLLLAWPAFILVLNTCVLLATRGSDGNSDDQDSVEKRSTNVKQIAGYAAAFLLPINYLVTFLFYVIHVQLFPDTRVAGDFFYISNSMAVSFFVFIGFYFLGLILGVIGVIMIVRGQKNRRYVLIASLGLASHILPLLYIVVVRFLLK